MIGDLGFHLTDGICDEICRDQRERAWAERARERSQTGRVSAVDERTSAALGLAFGHVWRASALARVGECILGQIRREFPCAERQALSRLLRLV